MLDPKNKGPPTCTCLDLTKKAKYNPLQSKCQSQPELPNKKVSKKKNTDTKFSNNSPKKNNVRKKVDKVTNKQTHEVLASCKIKVNNDEHKCKDSALSEPLVETLTDTNGYTMWIEVKKRLNNKVVNRNCRSSSEHSSQDYGYSSELNVSSSSLPSTPEGSEVACSDSCCNHESDCPDAKSIDKLYHLDSSLCLLKEHGGGPTLSQMLEVYFH